MNIYYTVDIEAFVQRARALQVADYTITLYSPEGCHKMYAPEEVQAVPDEGVH